MSPRRTAALVCLVVLSSLTGMSSATATHDTVLGVFVNEPARIPFVPNSTTIATDLEFADYEPDGDLDLFVTRGDLAGALRANQRFINAGAGTFTRVTGVGPVQADYVDVDLGDVNGDGRIDAILSVNLGVERLLFRGPKTAFSDRTAKFMPPGQPADVTIESDFFDADGDGDLDIITANEDPFVNPGAQNRLYLNNGRGRFTDATGNLPVILDDTSAFAIADFDGDGDNDVISVNDGPFFYLENDGTGEFTDDTANHLPLQPTNRDSGRDAVVHDFDGDGDLDVMFAISRADFGPLLWMNDGAGVFTDVSTTNVPLANLSAQDLEACDIDGDGDMDVIEANTGRILSPPANHLFEGARERILVNDGAGTFADVSAGHIPSLLDSSFAVACGDITGDGLNDLIVANGKGEPMRVFVQQPAV